MNEGYFIGRDDKTSCGGKILDGDSRVMLHDLAHAREDDRVTCGKDGETYQIVGGVSHVISHGKRVAGTLDSFSNCPCKAQLIPSVFTATYQNGTSPAPQATRRAAQPAFPTATSPSVAPRQSSFTPSSNSTIADRSGTTERNFTLTEIRARARRTTGCDGSNILLRNKQIIIYSFC